MSHNLPIMPFRKSCPVTSHKLVPPFNRSEVKSHGANVWRASCIRAFRRQNMTRELGRRGKAYINSVYFLSLIQSSIYSCLIMSLVFLCSSYANPIYIRFSGNELLRSPTASSILSSVQKGTGRQ